MPLVGEHLRQWGDYYWRQGRYENHCRFECSLWNWILAWGDK